MIEHLVPIVRIKNLRQSFYLVYIKEYNVLNICQIKCNLGLGLQWIDSLTDNVLLSETETIFILDLDSNVISQEDNNEYNRINEKNKIYMEVRDIFYF
jgi:hypothetical protein